ncbi:glycoside hydrolase family 9 protein [Parvularcula oceani]|uniref:glycoside hydrolase family 9 protein n=1 Tax=Parvularcula oceani TaxID=1247963 RepID=UPI0004E226B6|nr:glycoside hydrolase family 9 protein [Parvularcula oceani]
MPNRPTEAALCALMLALTPLAAPSAAAQEKAEPDSFEIGEDGYFDRRGANVLVFSNWYDSLFSDAKISGVELIHHGQRTVTNGDVRLSATPGQWEPIGRFGERRVDEEAGVIEADLSYPDEGFEYTIRAERTGDGAVTVSVLSDEPVPEALAGKAGFNLEFLPSAYWSAGYLADGRPGRMPRYPAGDMTLREEGPRSDGALAEPEAFASGQDIVLAPEDPLRRVRVTSNGAPISLYDGRNQAQNGWFVLRSVLPEGETGTLIEWTIAPNVVDDWTREPVISHSQVGYTPGRGKVAVVELDRNDTPAETARILRIGADGAETLAAEPEVEPWGGYLRYDYATIDFSSVEEPGLYVIDYEGIRSAPFLIAEDAYSGIWKPTMDVFFPVQMDHMFVNEAYRVWHGASHLDDALQAPTNHEHHDLYRQGPTTDTEFEPLEHIPGLAVGGWYDAGDYDIRTQSQYGTVRGLVSAWEDFAPQRDETKVDWDRRRVDLHVPDGEPDMLQQIKHGTLQLVAQFDAVGHAIHGIVEPDLDQYTHLGDGVTKTDNLIYNSSLGADETEGGESGRKDDRWAFTSKASALNYGSAAGLAAAARALRGYDDALADKALGIAEDVWAEEQGKEPDTYSHGNTTGGPLEAERFTAAAELYAATGEDRYAEAAERLWPEAEAHFGRVADAAFRILPDMPASYRQALRASAEDWLAEHGEAKSNNPFGVRITEGGWAGAGTVVNEALVAYDIHSAFPDLSGAEDVLAGLDFILGRHPGHNLSLVSGVGARSKEVAYGTNRADFSFIAGGVVPGILVIKPDFPENKEDWPFFWGENEYVIPLGADYVRLVAAARDLTSGNAAGSGAGGGR